MASKFQSFTRRDGYGVGSNIGDGEGGRDARRRAPEPAEEPWGGFFDLSLDLLCVAGLDGYFRQLNSAWTLDLGWTIEELKALPYLDFVHPDDRAATQAEVSTLAEGGSTILFENRFRCRDGSYRWLQWNARTMPGRQEIYAVGRDITHLQWLKQETLRIGDRERARLGRDLHDGLCQTLAGIAALSTTLSRTLAAHANPIASAAAAEIAMLLNDTIGQARDLARGLDPVGLRLGELDDALEQLARDTVHRFRVACAFAGDRPIPRLGQAAKMHLFRIAQQAVQNALSHGKAGRIEISLVVRDGRGHLSVADDGVGMPAEEPRAEGIELHTMVDRADAVGGSLAVRRRDGGGTVVTCAFPWPDAAGERARLAN